METKEFKIQIPEGYEIDKENSTFECIKFKSIKKNITYEDVCKNLFGRDKVSFYITDGGMIDSGIFDYYAADKNNATNKKQLERVLALNQLLNIAEYYNRLHTIATNLHTIIYNKVSKTYYTSYYTSVSDSMYSFGIKAYFNREEDAQAVIDNPNFREILDTIYKDLR